MPPKKRKKKQTMTRQSQRQSVVVNIGKTTKTRRRKSGKGGLPPPSYQHNLTPVVLPQQQVDYSPLILAMMQNKSFLQETIPPVNNLQPTASQMAGESAMRRAGQTADNFQSLPSQSDERYAKEVQETDDVKSREVFESNKRARSEPEKNVSGGGGLPVAEAKTKLGAKFKDLSKLTQAQPFQATAQQATANLSAEPRVSQATGQLSPKPLYKMNKTELLDLAKEYNINTTGLTAPQIKEQIIKQTTPKKQGEEEYFSSDDL